MLLICRDADSAADMSRLRLQKQLSQRSSRSLAQRSSAVHSVPEGLDPHPACPEPDAQQQMQGEAACSTQRATDQTSAACRAAPAALTGVQARAAAGLSSAEQPDLLAERSLLQPSAGQAGLLSAQTGAAPASAAGQASRAPAAAGSAEAATQLPGTACTQQAARTWPPGSDPGGQVQQGEQQAGGILAFDPLHITARADRQPAAIFHEPASAPEASAQAGSSTPPALAGEDAVQQAAHDSAGQSGSDMQPAAGGPAGQQQHRAPAGVTAGAAQRSAGSVASYASTEPTDTGEQPQAGQASPLAVAALWQVLEGCTSGQHTLAGEARCPDSQGVRLYPSPEGLPSPGVRQPR